MAKTVVKVVSVILIILAVILFYKKTEQNYIEEQKRIEMQMKATRTKR